MNEASVSDCGSAGASAASPGSGPDSGVAKANSSIGTWRIRSLLHATSDATSRDTGSHNGGEVRELSRRRRDRAEGAQAGARAGRLRRAIVQFRQLAKLTQTKYGTSSQLAVTE